MKLLYTLYRYFIALLLLYVTCSFTGQSWSFPCGSGLALGLALTLLSLLLQPKVACFPFNVEPRALI